MKKELVWYNSFWLSRQQYICLPHPDPTSPQSLGLCCSEILLRELQDVKMEKEVSFLGMTISCRGTKELVNKSSDLNGMLDTAQSRLSSNTLRHNFLSWGEC